MGGYNSLTEQPTNFTSTTPAAPSGAVNVIPQAEAPTAPPTTVVRHFSAYMPPMTNTAGGAVPTPPNDSSKCLDGTGHWSSKGGGGGGTPNISQYLSPSSITPPTLSSWAYHVNATFAANANGALVMTTHGSVNPEILGETIPVGSPALSNFDMIACFAANPPLVGSKLVTFGIEVWDSISGKIVSFQINMPSSSSPQVQVDHYPSFTGTPTVPFSLNVPIWSGSIFMRINRSGGNFTFYLSVDGQSWDQCFQESVTAYLPNTADTCGIGFYNNSSTPANVVIPHFSMVPY